MSGPGTVALRRARARRGTLDWRSRPPRTAAQLLLRCARLKIAREIEERHGFRPALATIDAELARYWYRIDQRAAELVKASAARHAHRCPAVMRSLLGHGSAAQ